MPYYIFDGSSWVEVAKPNQGQRYRFQDAAGGMVESYWSEQVSQYIGTMSVTVNGSSVQRHVANTGVADIYRIECSLPITDSFAVPLEGLFGAKGRTIMFEFVNGIAERSIAFTESGEWVVNEEQINKHLPTGNHFRFSGLNLSVAE